MVTIRTACGQCRTELKAPVELAGKLAACPKCQAAIMVPNPEVAAGGGKGDIAIHNTMPLDMALADKPTNLTTRPPLAIQGSVSRGLNVRTVMVVALILLPFVFGAAIGAMIEHNRVAGERNATTSSGVPAELQPGPNNQLLIEYYDFSTGRPALLLVKEVHKAVPGVCEFTARNGARIVVNGSYRLYYQSSRDLSPPDYVPPDSPAANIPWLGDPKYKGKF